MADLRKVLGDIEHFLTLLRVQVEEKPPWSLAKLPDVSFVGHALLWVGYFIEIYKPFVRVWMVYIVVLNRVLLAAENEIYPVVQIGRHMLALKRLTMFKEEIR